eukprot:g62319.t1
MSVCEVVTATAHGQVRRHDTRVTGARPLCDYKISECALTCITATPLSPPHSVYVGDASGVLAHLDLRTGKEVGRFKGEIAGSLRSVCVHPAQPKIASVGLDRFLRVHDLQNRSLLAKFYLKQKLNAVLFSSWNPPAPSSNKRKGRQSSEKKKSTDEEEEDQEEEDEEGSEGEPEAFEEDEKETEELWAALARKSLAKTQAKVAEQKMESKQKLKKRKQREQKERPAKPGHLGQPGQKSAHLLAIAEAGAARQRQKGRGGASGPARTGVTVAAKAAAAAAVEAEAVENKPRPVATTGHGQEAAAGSKKKKMKKQKRTTS